VLLLGFIAAWLACAAYWLAGQMSRRSPKGVVSLISGALSSAALLVALTWMQSDVSDWASLLIAAAISMVVAVGASFFAPARARQQPALK